MLHLSASLYDRPVLSLRTGGPVATALAPIINPDDLKVEGWYCQDLISREYLILQTQDVRDMLKQGIVINDHEVLSEPDDLVRLRDVLERGFELLGKPVETVSNERLGKVSDFAIEVTSFFVQKLYVAQPLLKSLSGGSLTVERTQIVEVTDKKVIVKDPLQPVKASKVRVPLIEASPAN